MMDQIKEISTTTFKHTLKDICRNTENRKFCFVLGAGASRSSGIPTGGELAHLWHNEIAERLSSEDIGVWEEENNVNKNNLAESYGSIYRKRFENDKNSGYEFLIQAMKDAKPSFGHIVMAQILTKTSGHCVLTTNFDSLVESSVYQFTDKSPLVCGHESLSGYARPSQIHPLIIKIHRDLLMSPKSDPDEISELDPVWKQPLDYIFSNHIPIIIGYGGNDGSLMSYFEAMNKPSNFFWCGLNQNDLSDRVIQVISKQDGRFVKIEGFDELMLDLAWVFENIKPVHEELKAITDERIRIANSQLETLSTKKNALLRESDNDHLLSENLSALELGTLAENEPDLNKRKEILLKALELYPEAGWLWWELTYLLNHVLKEYEDLEIYYLKGLPYNNEEPGYLSNYAMYLAHSVGNIDKAEEYFLKSVSLPKKNWEAHTNYAKFLTDFRNEFKEARKHYELAMISSPNNSEVFCKYGYFLFKFNNEPGLGEFYMTFSLSTNPENAEAHYFYAKFLQKNRKTEAAQKHYKNAMLLDSDNYNFHLEYAVFAESVLKDKVLAEQLFQQALSLEKADFLPYLLYAEFLKKSNTEKADEFFLKAVDRGRNNITNIMIWGSYAAFLTIIKKDYKKAEDYFLRVIAIESYNRINNGNYAQLLMLTNRKKHAQKYINEIIRDELEDSTALEIWFYVFACFPNDYPEAEKMIQHLLASKIRSIGWDFEEILSQVQMNQHPDIMKLIFYSKQIVND